MAGPYHPYEQPGLEVSRFESLPQVIPPPDGLCTVPVEDERAKFSSDVFPTAVNPPSLRGYGPLSQKSGYESEDITSLPVKRRIWNKKKLMLVAAACLVVVIIAIVVGVTVGVLKNHSHGSGEPSVNTVANINSPPEMSGTFPVSPPGLAPTAISWGHPHLEIYALRTSPNSGNHNHTSVQRKYRNCNATGPNDFMPSDDSWENVGSYVDTDSTPSMAISHRRVPNPKNNNAISNATFINVSLSSEKGWRKTHWDEQVWNEWGTFEQGLRFQSSPAQAQYSNNINEMTTFVLSTNGSSKVTAYYYQTSGDDWLLTEIPSTPSLHQWGTPAVVAWNGDLTRLDVFVVAKNTYHLLHVYKDADDVWSEYDDLKGHVTMAPVVVSRAPGTLDAFVRSGDGGLWHLGYSETGNWSDWTRMDANMTTQGQPHALCATNDTIDVFVQGPEDNPVMLRRRYNSTADAWEPADGFFTVTDAKLTGPPSGVADGSGSISMFAYSADGLVWAELPAGNMTKVSAVTLATSIAALS